MGYKTAKLNALYQKDRRIYLKSKGICIRCGYREAISDMVLCPDCREKNNKSRLGKKNKPLSEEKKLEANKKTLERYYFRKEKGLCVTCGKNPALPGMTRCHECRMYFNQYRSGYFEHTAKYIRKEIELGRL